MSGGTSGSTQNGNGMVDFNPTSIGGGNIQVGGSVGQGAVSQGSSSQASGASVGIDFKMDMPGMDGMPGMGGSLQNLDVLNLNSLPNSGWFHNFHQQLDQRRGPGRREYDHYLDQFELQNLGFLDLNNFLDNIDTSGPQVVTNQQNTQTNTVNNNGGINMQSNNVRTQTATGGGPNIQINGQAADAGDVKNILGGLFGQQQQAELQNLRLSNGNNYLSKRVENMKTI